MIKTTKIIMRLPLLLLFIAILSVPVTQSRSVNLLPRGRFVPPPLEDGSIVAPGANSGQGVLFDPTNNALADINGSFTPLSTSGSTIVMQNGTAMNFRCIDWPGHMAAMVPEGLQYQSVNFIVGMIKNGSFNCVRLNYAVQMIDENDGGVMISKSFADINLTPVFNQAVTKNPWMANASRIQAFDTVISVLGQNGIMVILDNTVSKAQWCCSDTDGNGFFGLGYFDVDKWRYGLRFMAQRYSNQKNVVAMSLRNELRFKFNFFDYRTWHMRGSTEREWFEHTTLASALVHKTNPNVLIIVSGLDYDTKLDMLKDYKFPSYDNKLVFEIHWYAWTDQDWKNGCAASHARMDTQVKTLLDPTSNTQAPVFLSEFGFNLQSADWAVSNAPNDLVYVNCVHDWVTKNKVGWSLWAISGSLFLKEGVNDFDDPFGYLIHDWSKPRSSSFGPAYFKSMP